jgi:hypothetical protein
MTMTETQARVANGQDRQSPALVDQVVLSGAALISLGLKTTDAES